LTKQSIARRNVSIHRNAGSGENELSGEMNWFFAASPTLMRNARLSTCWSLDRAIQ